VKCEQLKPLIYRILNSNQEERPSLVIDRSYWSDKDEHFGLCSCRLAGERISHVCVIHADGLNPGEEHFVDEAVEVVVVKTHVVESLEITAGAKLIEQVVDGGLGQMGDSVVVEGCAKAWPTIPAAQSEPLAAVRVDPPTSVTTVHGRLGECCSVLRRG
jgi:hypothetical protein